MTPEEEMDWEKWWFVSGGGIHVAFKYRMWSTLKNLVQRLPKLAWDYQQKKLDKVNETLHRVKEDRKEVAFERDRAIAEQAFLEGELDRANAEIRSLHNKIDTFFDRIKHGDEKHQEWLKIEIISHFYPLKNEVRE